MRPSLPGRPTIVQPVMIRASLVSFGVCSGVRMGDRTDHRYEGFLRALPHALRFLLAPRPAVLSLLLGVVYRRISGHLLTSA